MNQVMNDNGEFVTAVGAPGSIARLKVERPRALALFAEEYEESGSVPDAFAVAGVDPSSLGGPMAIRAFIIASGVKL